MGLGAKSTTPMKRKMKQNQEEQQQDQEGLMLPVAIVGRIMKQVLPANAKTSKEAKETMQESATEFISFETAEAADKCHKENRKTVNGDDICWALTSLGFDNYSEAILRYLHKFRQAERDKADNQIKLVSSDTCTSQHLGNPPQLEFRVLEKGDTSSLP